VATGVGDGFRVAAGVGVAGSAVAVGTLALSVAEVSVVMGIVVGVGEGTAVLSVVEVAVGAGSGMAVVTVETPTMFVKPNTAKKRLPRPQIRMMAITIPAIIRIIFSLFSLISSSFLAGSADSLPARGGQAVRAPRV